ncbi:MAG: hypothetical protein JNL82_25320 [Myxococcales bacterium]|nr:hypothetical protein [Myxococcales bacterium]
MYPEALLADDDDGDLANGTPNECEINLAFNAHGLLGAGAIDGAVLLGAQTPDGFPVTVTIEQGTSACVDLEPTGATLRFRVAGSADETEAFMGPAGDGFLGLLPSQADGTLLEYQVSVDLSDGSKFDLPQNPGDPWYQLYFGPVTPLYCTSFENPPELAGWTPSGQFEFGPPQGQSGDPAAAFLGGSVAGVNLAGLYGASSSSSLQSPVVDTTGFPTVRLQYRRWLNVEDGVFDQAFIRANGSSAWTNTAGIGSTHTRDEEWRFHDVDVTSFVDNGAVQLEFSLQSDGGLEMGGWNIDQLCLVGTDAAMGPSCGNGVLEAGEGCDAGGENSDTVADACRTDCQPARCGDAVLDSAEGCDDGNAFSGDGCSNLCTPEVAPGTTTATTGDTPTGGFDDGESGASETDGSGSSGDTDPGQDSFADRPGCACRSDAAAAPLGLLVLLALRRRRRP